MELSLSGTLPVAQFKPSHRQEFEAWILDRLWTDQRYYQQSESREASGIGDALRLDHARVVRLV